MENCKRKRSENWNEEDKMLLKELIRKRVSSIENKNTDTNTNSAKRKAWDEVLDSFNDLCTGGKRSIAQLKTQWTGTKIAARKEAAEQRKELKKTGGGSQPQEIPISSNDISVWLPNEFAVDSNEFDSDDILLETLEESPQCKPPEEGKILEKMQTDVHIVEDVAQFVSKRKEHAIERKKTATDESIRRLTEFDIECRTKLHEKQMEVERLKIRNLKRKYDLIEMKMKFYEQKSVGMYALMYSISLPKIQRL